MTSERVKSEMGWVAQFLPDVRQVLSRLVILDATPEQDMREATDLVLIAGSRRIGVRIRRPGYADTWPWQFTIRTRTRYGADTEIHKIARGEMDWFVYGHTDGGHVVRWFVLDMDVFRQRMIAPNPPHGDVRLNGDGTGFVAYDVTRFPPALVIDASHPIPYPAEQLDLLTLLGGAAV